MISSSKGAIVALGLLLTFGLAAQETIQPTNSSTAYEIQQESNKHEGFKYRAKQAAAYTILSGLIATSRMAVGLALSSLTAKNKNFGFEGRIVANALFPLLATKLATTATQRWADVELSDFYLYQFSSAAYLVIWESLKNLM